MVKLLGEGSYGKVMLAVHNKSGERRRRASARISGTCRVNDAYEAAVWPLAGSPMALKFFPRASTSLCTFLREYNVALRFCTHPSLSRALGIAYSTPSHYVFAQQAGLFGDLYDFIVPEANTRIRLVHVRVRCFDKKKQNRTLLD